MGLRQTLRHSEIPTTCNACNVSRFTGSCNSHAPGPVLSLEPAPSRRITPQLSPLGVDRAAEADPDAAPVLEGPKVLALRILVVQNPKMTANGCGV